MMLNKKMCCAIFFGKFLCEFCRAKFRMKVGNDNVGLKQIVFQKFLQVARIFFEIFFIEQVLEIL